MGSGFKSRGVHHRNPVFTATSLKAGFRFARKHNRGYSRAIYSARDAPDAGRSDFGISEDRAPHNEEDFQEGNSEPGQTVGSGFFAPEVPGVHKRLRRGPRMSWPW